MKVTLLLAVGVLLAYLVYEIVPIANAVRVSADLVVRTRGFERAGGIRSMLVLGDSTAVGVGASEPQYSVAGRLSALLDASAENHAVSGAITPDLAAQIKEAERNHYDLILVQIGANDVIKLRSLAKADAALQSALTELVQKSDRIVILTAGKIGNAPLFPWFVAPIVTHRAALLRDRFIATIAATDAAYVDLYAIRDPFNTDPARYYALDGLHLADDGYAFWYEEVRKVLEARWPELRYGKAD